MTVRESLTVETAGAFVHVTYERVMPDGTDMGGTLVVEKSSVRALADAVAEYASGAASEPYDAALGLDRLRIYRSGSDYAPFVNVLNRRGEAAPNGGLTGIVMTAGAASDLVQRLKPIVADDAPIRASTSTASPAAPALPRDAPSRPERASDLLGRFERNVAAGPPSPSTMGGAIDISRIVFVYADRIELQWQWSHTSGHAWIVIDDAPVETIRRGAEGWPEDVVERIERELGADVAAEVRQLLR